MADVTNSQLAVWLAFTTRPDLRQKLTSKKLSPNDVKALKSAGIDPTKKDTQTMVDALKPRTAAFEQINGVFHSAVHGLLGEYAPPDCPSDSQLSQISGSAI